MAKNLAGVGRVLHLSEGDILGIATALSSVGIEAEKGGTAISTFLTDTCNTLPTPATAKAVNAPATV